MKKLNKDKKREDKKVVKVRGHTRCVRNRSGRCVRRVRVSSHTRRIPPYRRVKRWRW